MRGKLDENMPVEAAALLRGAGWSCDTVVDEGLGGADDATVAEACRVEARRVHQRLRVTRAIQAGIANHAWSIEGRPLTCAVALIPCSRCFGTYARTGLESVNLRKKNSGSAEPLFFISLEGLRATRSSRHVSALTPAGI